MANEKNKGIDLDDIIDFDLEKDTTTYYDPTEGAVKTLESKANAPKAASEEPAEDIDDYLQSLADGGNTPEINKLQSYLEKQGIEADAIVGDDGNPIPLEELDQDEIQALLDNLRSEQEKAADIDEEYLEMDDNLELIADIYQKEGLEGVVDLIKESGLIDVESMPTSEVDALSDEELLIMDLKNRFPESSDEEIEDLFDKERNSAYFRRYADQRRRQYKDRELEIIKQQEQAEYIQYQQQLNEDRKMITQMVSGIEDISGFENSNKIQSHLLPQILEPSPEDPQYSRFIDYLLRHPEKQYEALFYLTFKDQIKEVHDQELSEAEERGKKKIFTGLRSTPKHKFSTSRPNNKRKLGSGISLEDLD